MRSIFYIVFTILLTLGISQQVYADYSEVTIVPAAGSGEPGCEETANGCYLPTVATVDVGGVVIMSNTDNAAHTYTSGTPDDGPNGIFDTSLLMTGGSFQWRPDTAGEYPYFCMVHPWMIGTIIVQGTGGNYIPPIPSPKITSNEIGSAQLEYSIYNIDRHENELVKIFGNISNPQKGSKVAITITTPEYDSDGQHVFPTDKGYYELYFPLDYNSPEGIYQILVSYSNSVIGKLSFEVTHDAPLTISDVKEQIKTTIKTTIQSINQNKISIPQGTGVPGCEESFSCYNPFSVNIAVGETITWSNDDSAAHTVTSGTSSGGPTEVFDSSLLMAGESYSFTFDKSGSHDYFCMVHPWMTGTIDVIDSSYLEKITTPEPKSEPLEIPASFVDPSQDPWNYVERYENEQKYKDWFDKNYPEYSSIYEAVGLDESQKPPSKTTVVMDPEPTTESEKIMESKTEPEIICGTGTHLKNEKCVLNQELEKTDSKYWIKYDLSMNTDTNSRMYSVPSFGFSLSGGGYPFGAYTNPTLSDTKFLKVELSDVKNSKVTLTTKAVKHDKSEEYLDTLDFLYGENIFIINPNVKVGDTIKLTFPGQTEQQSDFMGLEDMSLNVQGVSSILVGEKDLQAIKSTFSRTISSEGGIGEISFVTFHEKNTGMLLIYEAKIGGSSGGQFFNMDIILNAIEVSDSFLKPKSPLSGGGCLIATATYGSELAPQVQKLREIRDNSLLQTESGTNFMKSFNDFYYSFSPTIADYERENPVFREMVKITITPMITSLSILNYVDMDSEESVLVYGISLIILNLGMYIGIPVFVIMRIRK